MNKLIIVVPCYNEEEVLPHTIAALLEFLARMIKKSKISEHSKIMLVNDGSRDRTWEIIQDAHLKNSQILGLDLCANTGHQNALMAGIEQAADICDVSISIDADLQDDVNAMEEMIDKYHSGKDVVFGVRNDRKTDTFFKRFTAQSFYKLMKNLGVNVVYNHADFRLLSTKAMKNLLQYSERNLFIRGIVTRLDQRTDVVYYARKERDYGESKYPLKKMLSFAWDGITSFSTRPIAFISWTGALVALISLLALACELVAAIGRSSVDSWALLFISMWFLGGLLLFAIGLTGQYIGKIYIETKHRPRYHVNEFLKHD